MGPIVSEPSQSYVFRLSVIFSVKAASATSTLIVEPGGYRPCTARFKSGLPAAPTISFHSSSTASGSNAGRLTIASTAPLRGAIATTAPRRLPKAR